jgi:hypothetical protein
MANHPFVADSTIPGLGASDLSRLSGHAGYGLDAAAGRQLVAFRRAFLGMDARVLRDLGLDRGSC